MRPASARASGRTVDPDALTSQTQKMREPTPDPASTTHASLAADIPPDARRFIERLNATRPLATYAIAVMITAVFGLELLLGGTDSTVVLMRMGALSRERVLEGEIWRMASATFLHGGFAHFAFNTFVLVSLGRSLERVIGTWRFLSLYGLSCLGGSALSLVFLDGIGVGASGGLWGLLVAEAVLAWRSQGILPELYIVQARKAATFNLVLNLVNSFRPHVDMWAHFGGGAVGGLLFLTGLITRGLPRLDDASAPAAAPQPGAWRPLGAVVSVVLIVGLALGLVVGRSFDLLGPVPRERVTLPEVGISLELPRAYAIEKQESDREGVTVFQVGDPLRDPGALDLFVFGLGALPEDQVAAEREAGLASMLEAFAKSPLEGMDVVEAPHRQRFGSHDGVAVSYTNHTTLTLERAAVITSNAIVRVDALLWEGLERVTPPGYAGSILETVEAAPSQTK